MQKTVSMTRLLSLLTAIIVLSLTLTANEHYLLPEHKSDLMHTFKQKISRADTVTIISAQLESPSLAKSIEKAVLNGSNLCLITSDLKSAAYYAKYKNTRIKVPTSGRIAETFFINILLIDQSDVCFSSLEFSEEVFKKSIGTVTCTTNREDIDFAIDIEKRFSKRFEDYNR